MNSEEMDAAVRRTLERQQAVRDAIPPGPGLVLSEREAHVVAILISRLVEVSSEDIEGIMLYYTGAQIVGDAELVALGTKIRTVLARTNHVPKRSI
jgi:hypothetical protein